MSEKDRVGRRAWGAGRARGAGRLAAGPAPVPVVLAAIASLALVAGACGGAPAGSTGGSPASTSEGIAGPGGGASGGPGSATSGPTGLPSPSAPPEMRIHPPGIAGVGVPLPSSAFDADGDEIQGWWWLRDPEGARSATWAFFGVPSGEQIGLDLEVLATDTLNGRAGVDAHFYLTYGSIVDGGPAAAPALPASVTLPNHPKEGDAVGYRTTGGYVFPAADLAPGATGVWVRIGRRGPDGRIVSEHIAVRASSVRISGLEPRLQTPGPDATPLPSATSLPGTTSPPGDASPPPGGAYGSLTITTECQTWSSAPMTVTGSAAPDLRLEFAPSATFAEVWADDTWALAPPSYTYVSVYGTDVFPNGIWVRYAGDHSVVAHATNKGWCDGFASPTPRPTATPEPTDEPGWSPPPGPPTIVSIGDSYISGEGGRWAGNSNESYLYVDALGSDAYKDNAARSAEVITGCHRSESAEVHVGQGGYGPVTSINLACSGATTQTRKPGGVSKPGIDRCPTDDDRSDCPAGLQGQATMLEAEARAHDVRLVALSIGGNDFEFSDTVAQCARDFAGSPDLWSDYCNDDGSVLARFSDDNVAAVKAKLVGAYEDVVAGMRAAGYPDDRWSLIVQSYPSPIPSASGMRHSESSMTRFNVGCPFWDDDADWANDTALPLINGTIADAVAEFAEAYPSIDVHILDVSQAFVGHRLCEETVDQVGNEKPVQRWTDAGASDGSEWVAAIRGVWSQGGVLPLPGSVYYKNESFHPSYWGQLALRSCLRQAWNGGDVRGGTCTFMQPGVNAFGEPQMILAPD
jgi:hypothetical protein